MEKIIFNFEDTDEIAEFYVLEQTRINGSDYILVTDSDEDDAEALILKDLSPDGEQDALYEIVEDEDELEAVSRIFSEMLEDIELV
jgi:ferric iron reductase protein FhuF